MGIFKRIHEIFEYNVGTGDFYQSSTEESENEPARLQEKLNKATQALAIAQKQNDQLEQDHEAYKQQAQEWTQRAHQILTEENNQAKALKALQRKSEAESQVNQLNAILEHNWATIHKLRQEIDHLQEKINQVQNQ